MEICVLPCSWHCIIVGGLLHIPVDCSHQYCCCCDLRSVGDVILLLVYVFQMSPLCAVPSMLTVLVRPTKALYLCVIRNTHVVRYRLIWLVLFMITFDCLHKSQPFDRLHRFDAIGPRAYGGPAVMGDSRINRFFKYAVWYHTNLQG
jgi:hypothetical protein